MRCLGCQLFRDSPGPPGLYGQDVYTIQDLTGSRLFVCINQSLESNQYEASKR